VILFRVREIIAMDSRRIWGKSELRISRFHDEKGQFGFSGVGDLLDFGLTLGTFVLKMAGFRLPIPWLTFKANRFIKSRVRPDWKVFEWGSGMSTIWWEREAAEVYSIDHDAAWVEKVGQMAKGRASVRLQTERDGYVGAIESFERGFFDVIIIDGIYRLPCFERALSYLKPGGFLIVDNTDRDRTTKGDSYQIDLLLDRDKRLAVHRFSGWAPAKLAPQETTVSQFLG
jgi:SAM-dependent methyltransferase